MGFDFSTDASYFMRSASAAAVTRMRFASASARFLCRSTSALLSMILACAAASAFCSVDSLRACASSLVCSICFCFSGSVYCIGVRFRLGLQNAHLCLRLCSFYVARFLCFRLQLRNLHLPAFDLRFSAQPLVLLLLQQQPFKSFGVL